MLQLYFIRHGQSVNNVILDESDHEDYLIERVTDPDLTQNGIEQAELVADFVSKPASQAHLNGSDPQNREGFGLTHLYCSLMIRAIKTALPIARMTGLPLVARPEVHETGGIFEVEMVDGEPVFIGKPGPGKSMLSAQFPDLILPEDLPETGWWNQGREQREQYMLRARRIVDNLLADHAGTNHRVGIVMHGGIFARILSVMFDIRAERYWFLMNNCGISRVDVDEKGRYMLNYTNKVEHLPDHLIT